MRNKLGQFRIKTIGDVVEKAIFITWDYMSKTFIVLWVVGCMYGVTQIDTMLPAKQSYVATAEVIVKSGDRRDIVRANFQELKKSIGNSETFKKNAQAKRDAMEKEIDEDLNYQALSVMKIGRDQIYDEVITKHE